MARLLTGLIGGSLVLLAILYLPELGFFLLCAVVFVICAWEFTRIARRWAPHLPVALVPILTLALAGTMLLALARQASADQWRELVLAAGLLLAAGIGCFVLLSRVPVEESLPTVGSAAFGALYLATPLVSVVQLRELDPLLLCLVLAILWGGDTAAFYAGSRFGRHKLAPVVSPKKSWEGAAACFLAALVITTAWSWWQLGYVEPKWLLLAALTSIVAQLGDLVESTFKRGAGTKDSGNLLPGHGGLLDRLDSLFFGAPLMLLGIWLLAPPLR